MDKPTWDELLDAYEALAKMVLDEWPGDLVYIVRTWGDPVHVRAVEKVEAWRNAPASSPGG